MAILKDDSLQRAKEAEKEQKWNDAIKNYSEYLTSTTNEKEIALTEISIGEVYLWGLQDFDKAETHFLNGQKKKKKEADKFLDIISELTYFTEPRIGEILIDIRNNFLKQYSQNIVDPHSINPELKTLRIKATSHESAQIRILIYVGYKSWIKINIEVLTNKWRWKFDHFYSFHILKSISGHGMEIETNPELKNKAREKCNEIIEKTLKYFEKKFLTMRKERKIHPTVKTGLDTPETGKITVFEQPLPKSKDEIIITETEKPRVEYKKDFTSPPF